MKKIVLMLIAIFSMCCLVACGGETTDNQTATGNKESDQQVVVFSDITGKKVIVEQDAEVTFNLDEDAMALFIPEGYTDARVSTGIFTDSNKISIGAEYYSIFYLDPEKMREEMKGITDYCPAFLVMKGDERVILRFQLKIE